MASVGAAFSAESNNIKLYFMVRLPTGTAEIDGIADLVQGGGQYYAQTEKKNRGLKVTVNSSVCPSPLPF